MPVVESDTEFVISIDWKRQPSEESALSVTPKPTISPKPSNQWKPTTKVLKGKVHKRPCPVTYKTVSKDLEYLQSNSLKSSFATRSYSDILRNQLIRAHSHSLLEIALKFEGYRLKNPHNKDPTWFIEKVAEDLFVFTDQLQGISDLPEADRRVTAIDFEELAQPAKLGPFVGFSDPRRIIDHFQRRTLNSRIQ